VLPLLKGMAHITGGGLPENLPRVLPAGLAARVDTRSWQTPPLFRLIQRRGGVPEEEMFQVFNMGVGMVLVCAPEHTPGILGQLREGWIVGRVVQHRDGPRMLLE